MKQSEMLQPTVNGESMDHSTNMDKEYLEKNQKETSGYEEKRNSWESLGINQVTGEELKSSKQKMDREKELNKENAELDEFEIVNEFDQMSKERQGNKKEHNDSLSEERARAEPSSDIENITYR